jgi:threonine dehydrogenase-like Zn-dependent dehydrogenase
MLAVVTRAPGAMEVVERDEPPAPGAGEVIVRNDAIGLCGSDYHFLLGELTDAAGGSQFPRIQGHEVGATIAALGPGCRPELAVGQRVALWPLHACGACYPCSVGRPNTCDHFELIGIHRDGGLQQHLLIGEAQVYPIAVDDPAVAAMAEPISIGVRAVHRARIERGEKVVVLGAGPIGQSVCLLARERGADVLMIDLQEPRLELGRQLGADGLLWSDAQGVVHAARDWAGGGGPAVVVDATGVPGAVRAMVDMVASAGRAVQVGMSGEEVTLRIGSFTEKEIDMLGVSCCGGGEFAEAVAAVERNAAAVARMVSHQFELARAPEAIDFAISHPAEVMKVVILVD